MRILALILLCGPLPAFTEASNVITANEAASHIGEYATVCGLVAGAKFVSSSRGKPTYLNFDDPYPNHSFTVVIFGNARDRWTRAPEIMYAHQRVCATGEISEFRGKPQIVANWPKEIRLASQATPSHDTIGEGSLQVILLSPLDWKVPSADCRTEACRALVQLIDGAESAINFAAYGLRSQPAITDALGRAQQRGIVVRGIVDKSLDGSSYYEDTDELGLVASVKTDWAADRRTAQAVKPESDRRDRCARPAGFLGPLQCLWFDLGDECLLAAHASREPLEFAGDIMHNKFFVADSRHVWTGSANLSNTGIGGYNANAVVVAHSTDIALLYTAEFEEMYEAGRFHREKLHFRKQTAETTLTDGTHVRVLFSPQGYAVQRELEPLIKSARESIDVAMFFLTHKYLAAQLIAAHRRGVRVRVIVDATSAGNGYSKHELLRAAGIPVKVESWGGKMHMKVAVVDGRYSVLGSMNWTAAGETKNDENILIVESDRVASQITSFIDQMWDSIPESWLASRPDPESRDSAGSCADGIDNDFDEKVDEMDEGCTDARAALPELPPFWRVPKPSSGRCRDALR